MATRYNLKPLNYRIVLTLIAVQKLLWQTSETDAGPYMVRIRVSDQWDSAELAFEINVMAVVPKPTIEEISPGKIPGNTRLDSE